MNIDTIIILFISSFLTIVIGVISYLLKVYLKSIRLQLERQTKNMETLIADFHQVKIDLVKIEGALDNIKSKQSEAGDNIKEAKRIAFSNQERITKHGHDIGTLQHNILGLSDLVTENVDKIKKLEKDIIVAKTKVK